MWESRFYVSLAVLLGMFLLVVGCEVTPGAHTAGGKANITAAAVDQYLRQVELARPEIVRDVTHTLQRGARYRKRIRDQRNRWCLATVWLERGQSNVMHVVTKRNETCPACNGTGRRVTKQSMLENLPFDLRCLKCDGKGYLQNHVKEWKFVISAMDYKNPDAAIEKSEDLAYADAPAQTAAYVEKLVSEDPRERLEACEWLDQNYVRTGVFFQKFMPMLRKARYRETSHKQQMMVYQFWAGRGDATLADRAYYRIYVNTKSGEIARKGFYPER